MTRAFFMELRRTCPELRGPGDTVTNGCCWFFLTEVGIGRANLSVSSLPVEFGKTKCNCMVPRLGSSSGSVCPEGLDTKETKLIPPVERTSTVSINTYF